MFGTDAPFGLAPAEATQLVEDAIDKTGIGQKGLEKIYYRNFENVITD
ncbi:hypothetical protein [uncultured Lactobacillus sp.]|nr:hypothetical protein [uncultured Lactobacillus sp.]